jgi:hypothetical protein
MPNYNFKFQAPGTFPGIELKPLWPGTPAAIPRRIFCPEKHEPWNNPTLHLLKIFAHKVKHDRKKKGEKKSQNREDLYHF